MKSYKAMRYWFTQIILIFTFISTGLLAEEQIINDQLDNASKIHSMSAGWKFGGGDHTFDFDPGLLSRSSDTDQYIIYKYDNICDFQVNMFIHNSAAQLDLFKMYVSKDGIEWTESPYLLSNKAYRLGSWHKRIFTNKNSLPDSTNYFKIVVHKGSDKTWTPQLSNVKLWIENSRYIKLTEDFADSSVVSYSSPGWNWDLSPRDPEGWDGDSTFIIRNQTTEQYIVYSKPDLGYFDLVLYFGETSYFPEKLKFFISSDGNNFTEILTNNIAKGLNGNYGRYIFRPRTLFPEGTNFLKIIVQEGIAARGGVWFSTLSFYYDYQYSGYNVLTDPCQDFSHLLSKSNGWTINNSMNNSTELTTGRFHKGSNTAQNLVYQFENCANIKATVYWRSDNYSPGTFAFYGSADNITYTEIPSGYTLIAQTPVDNPRWNKVWYQPTGEIPKGTNYIKIESKAIPGNVSVFPRISEISLSQGPFFLCEDDYGLYDLSPINPGTGIELTNDNKTPNHFDLAQNYPNPFNPRTNIEFKLSNTADIKLEIFNTIGQRIARIAQGQMLTGHYSFTWDGRDNQGRLVNSGVYFYRLTTESAQGSHSESKKMILMK